MTSAETTPIAAETDSLPSVEFTAFVDFVVTRWDKWQPHGFCAQADRRSDYSLNAVRGTTREKLAAANALCAGCPVFNECGIYALATSPPDCIVSGIPFTGHPTQRRRLITALGLDQPQVQYLKTVKPRDITA